MSESSANLSQRVAEHQATLLYATERFLSGAPLSRAVRRAFLDTPRHLFAPRFYSSRRRQWIELDEEPLADHLDELYADHPLGIYRDPNGRTLSTISQPSLVLYMLELLELQAGQSVFELGGGSGWNAAMMGRLVGPSGHVVSVEIIESLARRAQRTVSELGLSQVDILAGDGGEGDASHAPYQRGVFTASAWDLPKRFFQQIDDDGLLLFVVKIQPGYDLLARLRKTSPSCFVSELHFPCSFVAVTGSRLVAEREPIYAKDFAGLELQAELDWQDIRIPAADAANFADFLKIVYDCQQPYLVETHGKDVAEEFWGFANEEQDSLILFNEDRVLHYGTDDGLVRLRRAGKRWLKAKQPAIEDLRLSIHQPDAAPAPSNDQWLVPRGDCALLWSLV